jgi:hypothetical protein
MVSTASDLQRFVRALFGGKLLRQASLAKIMDQRPGASYGWFRDESFGHKQMAIGGRSPGFISAVQYFLDDDVCIVVLTNSYSSMGQDPVVGDVAAMVYGQATTSGPVAPVPPAPGELAKLVGRYQMPANYFTPNAILDLQDRGDYLEARWSPGDQVSVFFPVGDNQYMDRQIWARVRFTRDDAGRATGFVYHILQDYAARKLEQ